MDLSQLAKLGKVAGVAGVALGAVALVLDRVVGQTGVLPEGWRGPLLVVVIVGAVIVAAAAIAGSARHNAQIARTKGDDSPAIARDRGKLSGSQTAATSGNRSPATTERG